ncbi:hypothetical protein D9M73_96090 [compost metagenome]
MNVVTGQRPDEAIDLAIAGERMVERGHVLQQRRVGLDRAIDQGDDRIARQRFAARFGRGRDHVDPLRARRRFARNVQPLRDQLALDFVELGGERRHVAVEIERFRLIADQFGEIAQFVAVGRGGAPALDRGFQRGQPFIDARIGQGRGEIGHQGRARAAFGQHAFGRVVGGVEIDVGQVADQPVGPAFGAEPALLAGHEFQAAMRAEMQHGVRAEILAQPAIESGKGVRRGETALEQQAHRIAFIAERRLQADEDIAELAPKDLHRGAIGLQLAGCRPPTRLDLGQPRFARDDAVGGDAGMDIGLGAIARGIAVQDRVAQRIHAGGHLHSIAFARQPLQRRVERGEHAEELRGARRPGMGREVEQHDGNALLGIGGAAQGDDFGGARGERFGALAAALHRADFACRREGTAALAAGARRCAAIRTTAEHHRHGAAVQLGNRDHHRRFERQQALAVRAPGLQRLELDRMRGDIGHVERGERRLGGGGVVIGRAAHQAETGQVDDGIDRRHAIAAEQRVDRWTGVETGGKGRNHVEPACLQRGDHAVIMAGILGQHIRAQH